MDTTELIVVKIPTSYSLLLIKLFNCYVLEIHSKQQVSLFLEHKSDMWQLDPDSMRWKELKPKGIGPEPRRRQALCQVVSLEKK